MTLSCRHGVQTPAPCDRCSNAEADRALQVMREDCHRERTRKQQLVDAFGVAGLRGLTGLEMQAAVGPLWRLRLRELCHDGFVFQEHASKVDASKTFRWVLVSEPAPGACGDDEGVLLEPPPAAPANAIYGDPS